MPWKKAPQAIIDLFDAVAPGPPAERRQMFGYPCGFVNGNMFVGVYQDTIMLRLPSAQQAEFLKQPGAAVFEPMPGKPMREYVTAPPSLLADREALRKWVEESLKYASTLSPKTARPKKKPSQR